MLVAVARALYTAQQDGPKIWKCNKPEPQPARMQLEIGKEKQGKTLF